MVVLNGVQANVAATAAREETVFIRAETRISMTEIPAQAANLKAANSNDKHTPCRMPQSIRENS